MTSGPAPPRSGPHHFLVRSPLYIPTSNINNSYLFFTPRNMCHTAPSRSRLLILTTSPHHFALCTNFSAPRRFVSGRFSALCRFVLFRFCYVLALSLFSNYSLPLSHGCCRCVFPFFCCRLFSGWVGDAWFAFFSRL